MIVCDLVGCGGCGIVGLLLGVTISICVVGFCCNCGVLGLVRGGLLVIMCCYLGLLFWWVILF